MFLYDKNFHVIKMNDMNENRIHHTKVKHEITSADFHDFWKCFSK